MFNSKQKSIYSLPFIGGIICLVLEFVFVFLGMEFIHFPLFLTGFFLIAYIPGRLLIKWLNLNISPLELFSLELGTGYVITTLAYFIFRYLKIEIAYFLLIGILTALYAYSLFKKEQPWPAIEFKKELFSLGFLIVLALILLCCGWLNFSAWQFKDNGSLIMSALHNRDSIFHASLVSELAYACPPHYPYAGNYPLTYHYFPDLFASIFVRWGALHPWNLTSHFLPLFYFTLMFLATFILARKLTGNRELALLTGFFIIFMGNMGFVNKLIGQPLYYRFWEGYFVPSTMILFINPIQIAVTLLCLGFFCLANYYSCHQSGWFFLTVLLLGIIPFYKVFTAIQVFVGLLIPALVLKFREKDTRLLYLVGATGVIMGLSFFALLGNSSYSGNFFQFKPWWLIHKSFSFQTPTMQRSKFTYNNFYQLMFASGFTNFLRYFVWYGILFLMGSMWLRIVGLKKWWKSLLIETDRVTWGILAYTVLAGIILSLFFTIPPEEYNTIAFLALSIYLMNFFAAWGVFQLISKKRLLVKIALVSTLVVFSLPTTIQLISKEKATDRINSKFVRLGQNIKQNLPSGSLVAHTQYGLFKHLLPALGGVRTLSDMIVPIENILGRKNATSLRKDNSKIFKTEKPLELIKIIKKHQVEYILEDRFKRITCNKQGILTEIYNQDGYILNKVSIK